MKDLLLLALTLIYTTININCNEPITSGILVQIIKQPLERCGSENKTITYALGTKIIRYSNHVLAIPFCLSFPFYARIRVTLTNIHRDSSSSGFAKMIPPQFIILPSLLTSLSHSPFCSITTPGNEKWEKGTSLSFPLISQPLVVSVVST